MNFSTNRQLAYLPVCRWLALLLLTVALFFALSDSAWAQATITVNTTTDEINNDGDCSLREAIESANTNFAVDACASGIGDDTILFEPALVAGGVQTINLTLFDTGLDSDEFGPTALTISSTLTIMGPSTNGITLTRGGVANFRLFRVTSNGSMTIVNLTLDNGVAAGGKGWGVLDGGAGGGGAAGMGGAIFNEGNVILENVTLRNNRALGGNGGFGGDGGTGNGGGGMGQDGVSGNDDINPGQGGGPNGGVGNIAAPTAGGNGGGGGGSGAFSADGGNGGFGGGGGGATGVGKTGGNGGFGGGGGGNRSDSGTTGLGGFGGGNSDRSAAGGGAGMGGAIFNRGGTVELLNTTVTANEAKGGDSIGNVAGAGHGLGGAIFNLDGVLILQYSTFTGNAVSVGTGSAPRADGGAIFNKQLDTTATVSLGTSILANTANGETDFYNDGGTVTGSQSNIVETNAADSNGAPSGLLIVNNGDPKLAPLANNGGPSLTHALLADSPAVDVSSDGVNGCGSDIVSDQRGVARPLGAGCDSGAYEAPAAITIRGNGQLIADGDLTPTSIDHTDFGSILTTDGALSRTFTVQNTGVTALTLTSSPAVTLTNDTHFAVTQQPASVTIASGTETTFTIAFDPATAGTHLVTVFVAYDAPNATPYTFAIRGTGVPPPLTCPVGGVLFVKVGGAGSQDGTSWDNAFATLQDALAVTNACEIWVANGVYYPDEGVGQTDNNRSATFQLKNDVAIYGGFVGTESQRTQRNWQGNLTVLSGDIDKNDTTDSNGVVANTANLSGANALHVVIGSDVTNTAVLDGFIITAGWANNRDNTCLGECGGGMYNQTGHPTLRNLIFQANSATFGGGLYNMSNSHPTLTDITFRANSALIDGGGLINNGSNATLTNILFESNAAANAGGLFNYLSTPLLNNLTFLTNTASNLGGGMVNRNSNPTLTDATFQANTASDGGGMYNYENSRPILSNLLFQTNSASLSGGGMLNDASNANLTNITFRANSAGYFGGGMFNSSSDPTLTNVIFEANMAEREGGGVDNYLSSPMLANVLFHANWAGLQGGGLLNFSDSNPTLTNVTFHANLAGIGGGIANRLASNPHLINTILWGNAISGTVQSTAQISNTADSTPVISYSLIEGSGGSGVSWQADLGSDGGNNLATDPLFVQNGSAASDPPTLGNVHLQSSSPAIDVGNSAAITLATDLDGNPRLQGSAVDMGAYETAKVISYTLSIAINGTGSGLITLNPPGEIYPAGTIVTVTATPNTGSNLEGWSGDCTDVGLCVVTVDANKAVTATFTLNQYNLITATIGNGNGVLTLDPPGGTYSHGTVVTVTAVANSGSTFAGWSGDCSGTDPCSVTMDASKAVTATFTLIPPNQYTLTTATSGSGSGVITIDPSGGIYTEGTVVTVTAVANSGSTFTGWSGDCSGTDPCSVTMDASKAVTATFTLIPSNQYTLTTATTGTGNGTITLNPPGGVYTEGTVVTVTASANLSSTFSGWSGACSGTDSCIVTMDANKVITADFTLVPTPRIAVSVEREGAGIVAPGTVVTYQVAITNVGQITVQLTSLQGTPQPVAQQLTAADTQALDAPCTAPITLAVGDVHRCTFTWTAAGNDGQQVNFIVTANGTANGQAATASGLAQVVIAAPTALDESGEPQPWRSYLPMVTKQ